MAPASALTATLDPPAKASGAPAITARLPIQAAVLSWLIGQVLHAVCIGLGSNGTMSTSISPG